MTKELGGIIAILTTVLLMAMTDALIKVFMGDVSLWQLFLFQNSLFTQGMLQPPDFVSIFRCPLS